MLVALIALSGLFLTTFLILQVRSYRTLKSQTRLMFLQSQEIKKQMLQLQEQNGLLAELNSDKQKIIGIVSHDLKGPLNRVFALGQLLSISGDNFTDEQKEYIGKIHQIVADGLTMMRNLLDNRRLDEKGIELHAEMVNVTAVVGSVVKNYVVIADKKKIVIQFTPQPISQVTDKTCVNRIVDNLLSNAIKFSPPGKVIVVAVREEAGYVEISVKDEGPGISAEDRLKLYQKYQRLSARPTGGETATGLGLYLVHAMTSKMKGEIRCDSEEGKGATFTAMLWPLTKESPLTGVN
jgi:two-component system sensor histidine kinase/response regulator